MGVVAFATVSTVWLFGEVPRDLEPKEDRGAFMIFMQAPEGASYEYTAKHMRQLEKDILFPLVDQGIVKFVLSRIPFRLSSNSSMNTGMVIMVLKAWGERDLSAIQVIEQVTAGASELPGVLAFPRSPSTLGRSTSSRPVRFVLGGSRHDEIGQWQADMMVAASGIPELRGLTGTYRPTQPQLRVVVDRERAAHLGVPSKSSGARSKRC